MIEEEIVKYFNKRKLKDQYTIEERTNRIEINVTGKLQDKINNNDKFYREVSDYFDNLGYDVDLHDMSTIVLYEQ